MEVSAWWTICIVYFVIWPLSLFVVEKWHNSLTSIIFWPLPDLGHLVIPKVHSTILSQCQYFTNAVSSITPLLTLLYLSSSQSLETYLNYMALLQVMRCFMFNVTILPDPRGDAPNTESPFIFHLLFGGTGDLIFSGHTMHMYAPWLFLYRHCLIAFRTWCLGLGLIGVCVTAILSTRGHYSIDIIVAIISSHFAYDILC